MPTCLLLLVSAAFSLAVQMPFCFGFPCQNTLLGHARSVNSAVWSPDKTQLASGSTDGSVKVWDVASGACLKTLTGHTQTVASVSWSSDGTKLASGSADYLIKIWDVTSGICLKNLTGHNDTVLSVSWSPDGTQIASGSLDYSIKLWDASSGTCLKTLTGHTNSIFSVSLSPDGTRLASGSADYSIKIWDVASGLCLKNLTGHLDGVRSVDWSPLGAQLASGSVDYAIKIWDVTSGICLKTLTGHTNNVVSVSWSPDGARIASGSADYSVKIWDVSSGTCLKTLTGHTNGVKSVSWSPDSSRVASGSADYSIKIWDVALGTCLKTLTGHTDGIASVGWSPSGTQIASGSLDYSIKIWDVPSGTCVETLAGHNNTIASVSWSPDGTQLVSGSVDYLIKIWDIASGTCLKNLSGHTDGVYSVSWSPDGTRIASGSADYVIKIWDVVLGTCLKNLTGHTKAVRSVDWSPLGAQLTSGADDRSVKIWDVTSGICLKTLTGHNNTVVSVSWSPDGTQIASGSLDYSIKLWDASSGTCLKTLTGHTNGVKSVSWSPDGTRLASGSVDYSIKIWDVASSACLKTLTGHTSAVASVDWSPDGTRLASGSRDSTIKMWLGRVVNFSTDFNKFNNTLGFNIDGWVLDESFLVQVFRRAVDQSWFGCVQVSLLGNNHSVTASLELQAPGIYGMAYYDRYSEQTDTPWKNCSDLTVNCLQGQGVQSLGELNATCAFCLNATYNDKESLNLCQQCKGDVDQDHTNCTDCPQIAYFNGERCACNYGYYPSNVAPLQCAECPSYGAVCDGDTLKAADDFWQTRDDPLKFLVCTNQEACRSGNCSLKYTSYLCGQCNPGYGQRQRLCEECPDEQQNAWLLAGSILLSSFTYLLLVYLSLNHQPSEVRMSGTALKLGISAAQANAMLSALGVQLTTALEGLIGAQMSLQNGGAATLSLSCAFLNFGWMPGDVFYATTLLWLLLGPLVCICCVGIFIVFRRLGHEISLRRWMVTALCCFVFTFHSAISLQTFQLFICRPVDSQHREWRLTADVAVECYTARHIFYMFVVGGALLVFYVIGPPVAAWMHLGKSLRNGTTNEIQFLCSEFKPAMPWWFLVVLSRKVALAALVACLSWDPLVLSTAMTFVLFFYFIIHWRLYPYASSVHAANFAEGLSLITSLCLLLLAVLVFLIPTGEDNKAVAGVVMVAMTMICYFVIGALVVKDIWKRLSTMMNSKALREMVPNQERLLNEE